MSTGLPTAPKVPPLRTQEEILEHWLGSEILVSIACTTYNQERYIGDAISGFLSQKTNFPFEIIIHDDASSDGTRSIVSDFQARYPVLIKPILSEVNQWSIYVNKPFYNCVEKCKGTYVAIGEGDDYWCDPLKLQKQVEAMQANDDVLVSFHPVHYLYNDRLVETRVDDNDVVERIDAKDIILNGGGYCPTPSLMFKRAFFESVPEWVVRCPVGDFYHQALAAAPAGAIRISRPMSVYRVWAEGSFTSNQSRMSTEDRVKHALARIESNECLANELDRELRKFVNRSSVRFVLDVSFVCLGRLDLRGFMRCVWHASRISVTQVPGVFLELLAIRAKRFLRRQRLPAAK